MVLTVETPRVGGDSQVLPTAEIAEHLARHGIDVSAARTVVTDGLSPADALLDYASDIGADLLVVGSYPVGQHPDINKGTPDENAKLRQKLGKVPLPAADPVHGAEGPLLRHWAGK